MAEMKTKSGLRARKRSTSSNNYGSNSLKFIAYTDKLVKAHRECIIRNRKGLSSAVPKKKNLSAFDDFFEKKQAALFENCKLYSNQREDDSLSNASDYKSDLGFMSKM